MSQPQPKSHPWHESIVAKGHRHSPEVVASVVAALAHASFSEVAAAVGLTRNMVCGIAHRAKHAGVEVIRKHGPNQQKIVSEKPVPRAPITGARVPKAVLRVVPDAAPDVRIEFGTGLSILEARRFDCRALDSVGDCCGQPTVASGSWCAGHRALYVQSSTRRAA